MFSYNYSVFDVSRNIQVFILRKTYTCSFMVFLSCIHKSNLVDGSTRGRNVIKPHNSKLWEKKKKRSNTLHGLNDKYSVTRNFGIYGYILHFILHVSASFGHHQVYLNTRNNSMGKCNCNRKTLFVCSQNFSNCRNVMFAIILPPSTFLCRCICWWPKEAETCSIKYNK